VTNASLIAGVGGGGASPHAVVLAGVAALVASNQPSGGQAPRQPEVSRALRGRDGRFGAGTTNGSRTLRPELGGCLTNEGEEALPVQSTVQTAELTAWQGRQEYLLFTVTATVADPPRLSVTVRLFRSVVSLKLAPKLPSPPLAAVISVIVPSFAPVEVTYTV
jgi:hypothetical protein